MTNIQKHLLSLKDEKYLEFHSKLCTTSSKPMIGIRVPMIKKYAKELLKERNVIFKDEYYEEIFLHGLYIAGLKISFEDKIKLIDDFLPLIDNWAVCDGFVSSLKDIKKNRKTYYQYVKEYINSSSEYINRYAIVVLLNHYMIDEYIDDILEIIKNNKYCGYYSLMAGAWLLSYCFIFYFDKTLDFINNNDIDLFVKKKGIQKSIESFRVSKDNKEILRTIS